MVHFTDTITGEAEASYEYDSYGQITQTTGDLMQPYAYTGREYDAESGLYHYRARAYDPTNGIFLQVDPIEFGSETFALYGYVSNTPFTFSDPHGLNTIPFGTQVAAGISLTEAAVAGTALGVFGVLAAIDANSMAWMEELFYAEKAANDTFDHAVATNGNVGKDPRCYTNGHWRYNARQALRAERKTLMQLGTKCVGGNLGRRSKATLAVIGTHEESYTVASDVRVKALELIETEKLSERGLVAI